MKTEFTEGPWNVQHPHYGTHGYEVAYADGLRQICQDVNEANANLIATAPDMYEVLEDALNIFRFYQGYHAAKGHSDKEQTNKQYADRIAKVLAKARGEA